MPRNPPTNSSNGANPAQRDRFIEMARELGSDEDEAAFKEKLAVIARHKPKNEREVKE